MDRGRVIAAMAPPLLALLLLLSRCSPLAAARHGEKRAWWEEGEGEWRPEEEGKGGRGLFVLDRLEKVVDSEAGKVDIVHGQPWPSGSFREGLMHIGFIEMEPKTLLVPQYLDSRLTLFVRLGEVQVARIYKDELVENKLKMGDVLHIDAGSTFYMVNTGKGQRLSIICSFQASDGLGFGHSYRAFFLGGAGRPTSVLAGFERKTIAVAFNTSYDEVARTLLAQTHGPFVYYETEPGDAGEEEKERGQRDAHDTRDRGARCREAGAWRPGGRGEEDDDECGNYARPTAWSWMRMLSRFVGLGGGGDADASPANKKDKKKGSAPEPYNLYDHDPDFRNDYGWTVAIDKHDYEPLKHSDIGVYLVNLTSGSMLAPHVNPRATEFGVVVGGEGVIQVVFPNGSLAMSATVGPGDVFWIPRYFPFCQVASRGGPFAFFGFTTSARRSRPQFLVGATSVLRTMLGPELAAGLGAREEDLRELLRAQNESIILPSFPGTRKERHGGEEERERGKKGRREREQVAEERSCSRLLAGRWAVHR